MTTVAALPSNPDMRTTSERVNVLGRDHNLRRSSQAVAALPSAVDSGFGARTYVTDSNATLAAGLGNVVAGGGANTVPVGSDGASWRIGF